MNILRAAATVGGLTGLSRLLGFLRDLLTAAILGAGTISDAYFVSFKLANFLRRLFAEGAFNAGFVPVFAKTLEGEGQHAAQKFMSDAFSFLFTILLVITIAAEIWMPWLVSALAAGFEPESERYRLAVDLSRITFPYLICISLAALLSGVLNAHGKFAAAAFAPVLLNLVLISALLLAWLHPQSPAHALATGVLIAGVLQLWWVARAAKKMGYKIELKLPVFNPKIRRLFALIAPGIVGAGVYQINLLVDLWFASGLKEGAVSYLFFADRITQLPLGIIGIAFATALLPALSRQIRAGETGKANQTQAQALRFALMLTLPAAVALFILAHPIITFLFERGAFDANASMATAAALAGFSIGLPSYVLIKILAPAYFAREDTKTPVAVAAVCLVVNVLFILILIGPYEHAGIALATSASNWVNAGLLLYIGLKRSWIVLPATYLLKLLPIGLANFALAICLIALSMLLENLPLILFVPVMIGLGLLCYFGALALSGGVTRTDLEQLKRGSKKP